MEEVQKRWQTKVDVAKLQSKAKENERMVNSLQYDVQQLNRGKTNLQLEIDRIKTENKKLLDERENPKLNEEIQRLSEKRNREMQIRVSCIFLLYKYAY
jgi:predicted  nucleic acid-binding Zn-ribbon protein